MTSLSGVREKRGALLRGEVPASKYRCRLCENGPPFRMVMKRPIAVTIISLVFIAAGALGLAFHLSELKTLPPSKMLRWFSY